ncbi:MAG: class I SAM-dependent methyltransferase [Candidatus Omnitrophota bacterium]|nr:class I SAM-dependent methyltransferase [Candidatus Omnitrophota bacterium]
MLPKIYRWFLGLMSRPDEKGEYSAGYWQRQVREAALMLCQRLRQGRVLEVGCGEGLFLQALARQNAGLEIWGVDNNNARLESAGKRLCRDKFKDIHLALQRAEDLDFRDEYFDLVICINVFFNLPSTEVMKQVLGEIKRVCRKSGRVIFDFRNADNPLLNLKYKLAPYYDSTVRDLPLKTYRPREIEMILKDLNFRILNKRFIGLALKRYAPIIIIEAEKIA